MELDPADKKQIRLWLDEFDHSYKWFAETLEVAAQTVYNWMSSDRAIPGRYHLRIQQLMRQDYERAETKQNLVLEFTPREYDILEDQARLDNKPLRQWAAEQLNRLADENLDKLTPEIRAMQEQVSREAEEMDRKNSDRPNAEDEPA